MNDFVTEIPDKPLDQYSEKEIREMFLELFFWVADNRPDWLEEAIARKRAQLLEKKEE